MSHLDNRTLIKQIDRTNYLDHILEVPEQLTEGYALGEQTIIPALYAQAKQVLIVASGDCLPVAQAVQSLAKSYARVPVVVSEDYAIPTFVDRDTLVIALDYAGSNETVVSAFQEAAKQKARLLAISVDGGLGREARRVRATHVMLTYGAPSRIAYAFMLGCLVALAKKLDLIEMKAQTVMEAAVLCRTLIQNISPDVPQIQNNAKQLAEKIMTHDTIIVGTVPLSSVVTRWNQIMASTGKLLVATSSLLTFNDTIVNSLRPVPRGAESPLVVLLQSKYDHSRSKMQQTVTYQVMQAQRIGLEQIFMHPSGSHLGEIMLASLLGDFVAYYLALLMQLDPSETEASTYIKERLVQEITE